MQSMQGIQSMMTANMVNRQHPLAHGDNVPIQTMGVYFGKVSSGSANTSTGRDGSLHLSTSDSGGNISSYRH